MNKIIDSKTEETLTAWFISLRNLICEKFESIETEYCIKNNISKQPTFEKKAWKREGGGGGVISIMHGNVFEKVGVNFSAVWGEFSEKFKGEIPGTENDARFFATGVSVVAHMCSPLVPAVHMNTRSITTAGKQWFGGGADLTPMYLNEEDTKEFHTAFKATCDKYDAEYYPKFKQQADDYFFLPHRNEPRGVGGIFYDYLSDDFENDFAFSKDVGLTFANIYPRIVRKHMYEKWTEEQREFQLEKRGRYVEFNLLHDRGTKFGLMTGGNTEAILMSMPPIVTWK